MSDVSLRTDAAVADGSASRDADAPVLAIPEGWLIDELARERLSHQLARAPDHIQGIVAETGPLLSGASYRVHAERLCLRALSEVTQTSHHTLQAAALLRPGIAFELRDGGIEVEQGPLLIDAGAHVHDPWRRIASIQNASALGRPPFPRRPVVVFLAYEPDVEPLDWARSIVNNLVRRDVEGRLAMLDIAEGLNLTQPCTPSEESIRALRPDVIVALDQAAMDRIPVWCGNDRSTVAVEFTPDVAATAELVSWQLERAQGRLRARIGRQIDAPSLVSLVNRLCSGPHPSPPTDSATPTAAVATVRALLSRKPAPIPEPATKRSVLVVTGNDDRARGHELGGLVDHLVGAGHDAQMCTESGNTSALRAADVVVLSSESDEDDIHELIEVRRLAQRPTIANIQPADVVADTWSDRAPQLADVSARLVTSCGNAITESSALYALLASLGLRVHLLPPLLTREFAADLRSARGPRDRLSEPVVGWHVGSTGTLIPDYADAVAEAVLEELVERPDLSVEIIGEPSHVPAPVLPHSRVRVMPTAPGAETMSRWTVHLWTPPVLDSGTADTTRPFLEASAVGVPTVFPKPIEATIGGCPSPELLVEDFRHAEGWIAALRTLLDGEATWTRQCGQAARYFDAMHGPAASDVAVNRLLGWAVSKEEQL